MMAYMALVTVPQEQFAIQLFYVHAAWHAIAIAIAKTKHLLTIPLFGAYYLFV